ncbi:MAG: S41 family peptidase [Crocinitomicaceae bacterium]|nr:S41 family peptidase [Crocinitomicaceae bacterium]
MNKTKTSLKSQASILILWCIIFAFSPVRAQSNGFEVIKNLELIDLIYMNLEKYYVDEPRTGAISKAGIDAMLSELDPYTVFYHEANIEDYRMMTTGQYGGIGALIRKMGDFVVVSEPYEGNPAFDAGLKAGDIILSIDGRDMKNKDTEEVSKALKGSKGTSITIKVDRPFVGIKEFEVKRDEIKMPDVPFSGMLKDNIGYIKLSSFTQTASKSVIEEFQKLKSEGMEKLILDLRGNGGGLLIESVHIVNMFVPKNELVVQTKARIAEENRSYNTMRDPLDLNIPIVVLIDEGSASASEIVAGTLQDYDRGVVIGRTSFGKGLVQRTLDLKYGSKMKLTIAKYYTPSGRCVQKLDYYHKNDGKVDEVPDSLLTIFKTRNGREVIDGRGIEPDIKIDGEDMARITITLLIENIIFDYATYFVSKHESIDEPETFQVTDEIYEDFKNFVLSKEFEYTTKSEEKMKTLLAAAKEEGYEELIRSEYDQLLEKVKASKDKDLKLFRNQIESILQNELVSRYHFQNGRIVNAFQEDEAIQKAIEVLLDERKYKGILGL